MPDVKHGTLRPGAASGIHVVHDWEVADEAERLALTTTELQVGKVCRQLSDATWWVLAKFTGGVEWRRLDNDPSAVGPAAPTVAPPNIAAVSAVGAAGKYATEGHTHGHGDQGGGTLHAPATTSTPGFMSSADKVAVDAIPAAPGAAPPNIAAASAVGAPGTYATGTHTHGHGDQAGGTLHAPATGAAAGFMSALDKTKLDGISAGAGVPPAAPVAAPPNVAAVSALGAGGYARESHTHGHGDQAGGTLHANAVAGGSAGFMSGTDKTKLDSAVVGPGTATLAAVPRYANGAGTLLANSGVVIDGGNNVSGIVALTVGGNITMAGGATVDGVDVSALPASIAAAVVGPASSVDNTVARFDGTTGKIVQGSGVSIDDANAVTGVASLTVTGNITVGGTVDGLDVSNLGNDVNALRVPPYLTLGATATLTNERVLSATAPLVLADGGAGGAASLSAPNATTSAAGWMSAADKTALGNAAQKTFTITQWSGATLIIIAAFADGLCIFNGSTDTTVTIPSDAMDNLPTGFVVNILHDGDFGPIININDANVTLLSAYGVDASDGLQQAGIATLIKIGANRWFTNGSYALASPA